MQSETMPVKHQIGGVGLIPQLLDVKGFTGSMLGGYTPAVPLHKALRAARLSADLTQEALAERSGVPQTSISKYERGAVKPDILSLVKLAGALSKSVDELVAGMDDGESRQFKKTDTDPLENTAKGVIKSSRDRINYDSMRQGTPDEPTQEAYATVHPVILAHLETISTAIQAFGDVAAIVTRLEAVNDAITQRATTWAMAPAAKKRSTATLVKSAGGTGIPGKRERKPGRKNR